MKKKPVIHKRWSMTFCGVLTLGTFCGCQVGSTLTVKTRRGWAKVTCKRCLATKKRR